MKTVAAIVLAAGGSTRLGQPKQLARHKGRSLIRGACEAAVASGANPVVVVLGSDADACIAELKGLPVMSVCNAQWRTGMASSIAAGLDALSDAPVTVDAALICLCDQPNVTPEMLRAIIDAHVSGGARIVSSEYDGILGAPALFEAKFFDDLRALQGDEGARKLFRRFADEVAAVPHPAAAFDVDTLADYERLVSDVPR